MVYTTREFVFFYIKVININWNVLNIWKEICLYGLLLLILYVRRVVLHWSNKKSLCLAGRVIDLRSSHSLLFLCPLAESSLSAEFLASFTAGWITLIQVALCCCKEYIQEDVDNEICRVLQSGRRRAKRVFLILLIFHLLGTTQQKYLSKSKKGRNLHALPRCLYYYIRVLDSSDAGFQVI